MSIHFKKIDSFLRIPRLHERHPAGPTLPADGERVRERGRPRVAEPHQQVPLQQPVPRDHLPEALHMPGSVDVARVSVRYIFLFTRIFLTVTYIIIQGRAYTKQFLRLPD